MKHFIGGFSIGLLLVLIFLPVKKTAGTRGDTLYIFIHLFAAFLCGLAAWGLLP